MNSWAWVMIVGGACVLSGCGREREKLGADCTEVGKNGAAHGLEPCFKLAAKYPKAKDNGLDTAWSGIQMHCSFEETLSPSRQKECDDACVQMRTFSAVEGAPSGVGGDTYVRTGTGMGECVARSGSGRSGGFGGSNVGLTE